MESYLNEILREDFSQYDSFIKFDIYIYILRTS